MRVNNFIEFKGAYLDALTKDVESLIELGASFALEEALPPLNHGQQLTITSLAGEMSLAAISFAIGEHPHFIVSNGRLILKNIRLCADLNDSQVMSYGGVEVRNQGALEMDQSVIESCKTKVAGALWIQHGGKVLLRDTVFLNCQGDLAGAVLVEEDASLMMKGRSVIQDCFSPLTSYGDQVVVAGVFQMQDGHVTFTKQPGYNGISVSREGHFFMEGGKISHCLMGLYLDQESSAEIKGGSIEYNDIGVLSSRTGARKKMKLLGGEIHSNRVGIQLNEGTEFLMAGGKIYNHLGMDGVGVLAIYANSGHFIMTGGEIFQNIQGICWQQTKMEAQIGGESKIYENAYGILMDYATLTVRGGQIFNNQMPQSGYAYGGIGIFASYNSELLVEECQIYGNQYDGILGHYSAMITVNSSRIYQNGKHGINLLYASLFLTNGEIYENGSCGVSLDLQNYDEPKGSQLEMNGSNIFKNNEDGIRLMGLSRLVMVEGEIKDNDQKGISVQDQASALIQGGRISGNYIGMELKGGESLEEATSVMEEGDVFENTVGIAVLKNGTFTLESGSIFENYGVMESMGVEKGGIGVLIHEGIFFMKGGRIYSHKGFAALPAELAYGQQLGAGVCILETGYFEMFAGEITNNTASSGAAIYVPDENYTTLKVHEAAYFNQNKGTESAFNYSGGMMYVDQNIAFSHTSVGCHILNNYDVNYQTGSLIANHFWDLFPDQQFAHVIFQQLDREWDAFIAPCELRSIKKLVANDSHIRSIEGVNYLTNLEEIHLDGNHILDLSPLEYFGDDLIFKANRQWRKLPSIYVSRQQPYAVYGPSFEEIEIEIPAVNIATLCSATFGELISIDVPAKQLEMDVGNGKLIVDIPSYQIDVEIPSALGEGTSALIPSYVIKGHLLDQVGTTFKVTIDAESRWFVLSDSEPLILSGNIEHFFVKVVLKQLVPTFIYKYNGRYFLEEDEEQRWWQDGTNALVWWERGRNVANWEMENFDGVVFQTAIPIPIHVLFSDKNIAVKMAQILHKNIEAPIDITELLRITHLDLHNQFITTLEGLQFLFNLKYINLRGTNVTRSEVKALLSPSVRIVTG